MFLLNQPISGRYFKIFVEILCSKNSGVHGTARTLYRFRLHGNDKVKVNNSTFPNGPLPTDHSPSRTV